MIDTTTTEGLAPYNDGGRQECGCPPEFHTAACTGSLVEAAERRAAARRFTGEPLTARELVIVGALQVALDTVGDGPTAAGLELALRIVHGSVQVEVLGR